MKMIINKIHHTDNAKFTPQIPDGYLDVILEDPPYLYLKNQKLDRPFDELTHFTECWRMLRKGGFIIIFGRGTSFYRWNTILSDLGFEFKESIVWDKSYCSSPLMAISRVHEDIAIWCKGKGKINKVKVPYLEMKKHDIDGVVRDIKRIRGVLNNPKSLCAVIDFLENNKRDVSDSWEANNLSISSNITKEDRQVSAMRMLRSGMNEKSIIRVDRYDSDAFTKHGVNTDKRQDGDRTVKTTQSVIYGMNEKSIIKQAREHYKTIHPTQKPPRLLERLLTLVLPQYKPLHEIIVADFFGGSCNTAKACITMGVNYIVTEIDKEYHGLGVENVEKFKEDFEQKHK